MKKQIEFESESQEEGEDYLDDRELNRQVTLTEWGPILALPVRTRKGWIQPTIDEDGRVEWGAFGTVDFSRPMPEFDKARYKADKLEEQLRDVLIRLSIVSERLPKARRQVLKYLERGWLRLEHIQNEDMLALARLYVKSKELQEEIRRLRDASQARRSARLAEVLQ